MYFANGLRACNVEQCTTTHKHLGSLHDVLLTSFRKREEKNRDPGTSISPSSSVVQTQSGHIGMKNSICVTGGIRECKAVPN